MLQTVRPNVESINRKSFKVEKKADRLLPKENVQKESKKEQSTVKIGILARQRRIKMRNRNKERMTSNTTQATLVNGKQIIFNK